MAIVAKPLSGRNDPTRCKASLIMSLTLSHKCSMRKNCVGCLGLLRAPASTWPPRRSRNRMQKINLAIFAIFAGFRQNQKTADSLLRFPMFTFKKRENLNFLNFSEETKGRPTLICKLSTFIILKTIVEK